MVMDCASLLSMAETPEHDLEELGCHFGVLFKEYAECRVLSKPGEDELKDMADGEDEIESMWAAEGMEEWVSPRPIKKACVSHNRTSKF